MRIRSTNKIRLTVAACLFFCLALIFAGGGVRAYAAPSSVRRAVIKVETEGRTYVYRDDILPAPDHTVYEQIERRSINAPLEEKIKTVDKCLSAGAEWREAMRYSFPRLPDFVQKIVDENEKKPYDSEISFRPDSRPIFSITRAKEGRHVDEKRLYQEIYFALRRNAEVLVKLRLQSVAPAVTEADNVKLTRKISEFSTGFASSSEGRKNNIRLALSKINGTVLAPGGEFSFNAKVGARTARNGFAVAKIIVAGEYVEGVGGGVCQASTTLYNAALTAGMKVTAVRNHTILPSYVPPSLDAMVNSGDSDLKFVNPYDTPVFIKAECSSTTAKVTFFGAEIPYVIKTSSREISRSPVPEDKEITDSEHKYTDPLTAAGTRVRVSYGHPRVKSEGYLRYYNRSGAFVREEKIRSDVYGETQGVVAVAP